MRRNKDNVAKATDARSASHCFIAIIIVVLVAAMCGQCEDVGGGLPRLPSTTPSWLLYMQLARLKSSHKATDDVEGEPSTAGLKKMIEEQILCSVYSDLRFFLHLFFVTSSS